MSDKSCLGCAFYLAMPASALHLNAGPMHACTRADVLPEEYFRYALDEPGGTALFLASCDEARGSRGLYGVAHCGPRAALWTAPNVELDVPALQRRRPTNASSND